MSIQALTRSQQEAAATINLGATIPGPVVPGSILLVSAAMAGAVSSQVDALSWAGVPLTRAHRAEAPGGTVLVNEWWYVVAPAHGANFLNGTISGAPRATVELFYVDIIDVVTPFGPIEDAIGTGAAVQVVLAPTHDVGTAVDLFNGRDFPYGLGGSYTPGPGQGFLDLGTVGTATGFYIATNKIADNGNTTMSGTIVPDMPWLYTALELRAPGEPGAPPPQAQAKEPLGEYVKHELHERTGIVIP